jgi:hypothetical protein
LPRRLQSVGSKLKLFSQAIQLARPRDAMRNASELLPLLQEATSEAEQWAKPFAAILKQIEGEAHKFAHDAWDRLDSEHLQKQLTLIEHFVKKGLWVQAILLAREWVVSWIALQRQAGDWRDERYREDDLEAALGAAHQRLQGRDSEVPPWFDELPESQQVAKLWSELTQLRNDVAHCGMRASVAPIARINQRAREVVPRLKALLKDVLDGVLWSGRVTLDLNSLCGEVAKLEESPIYLERAKELAGKGNEVVLTGAAPIWLCLAVAHALHGKARRLLYDSPTTGAVLIFDHSSS